jgi:hypothetical protein
MPDPVVGKSVLATSDELTSAAKSLLERVLAPSADEIGKFLGEKVHGYLSRNRTRVFNSAAQLVAAAGKPVREVAMRTMLPLIEGASAESDENLQGRWAALLANAATEGDADAIPPLFPRILANLTPLAAELLETLHDVAGLRTTDPQDPDLTIAKLYYALSAKRQTAESEEAADTAMDILMSQGLAVRSPVSIGGHMGNSMMIADTRLDEMVRLTALGQRFLHSVTPPLPDSVP